MTTPAQVFGVGVALTVAVLLGRQVSTRLRVPDAAAYVLVGVLAGLVPGLSGVTLSPDLVLLVFLPPLIHYAAFFSDPRETVEHIAPIVGQSVGLVLASAGAAAAAVVLVFPEVGWAAAIAFGAAIAPPDPVAATTVLQRLGVPRRLMTVLEGEGLVNDGVALTLFALAVSSVGHPPTPGEVGGKVALEVAGGVGIGLVVGAIVTAVRKRTEDGPTQVVLSLVTPYLAFVPAQLLEASGVLATVTAAVWLGVRGRGVVAPTSRVQTETFWRVLNLLLVAFLFVLLGLQVPAIVAGVARYPWGLLALVAAAVVVVTVAVRIGWVLLVPGLVSRLPVRRTGESGLNRRERLLLGWCGPRGAVSLAVALSLPLHTSTGAAFPERDLLLFLTVVVVLATVVGQLIALPAVLGWLRLSPDAGERSEGVRARRVMVDAALRELDGLCAEDERVGPTVAALRQVMEVRRDRLAGELTRDDPGSEGDDGPGLDERALWLRLLGTERGTLRRLHDQGEISTRTMVEVSQELDLDETRLRHSR